MNSLHPLLQRIYHTRGIKTPEQLDRNLERLLPFHTLLGIDQAVACLADAIKHQQNILIIGDFDADGATSSALAMRVLKSFGAKNINFLVPNRFAFGYGLTPELVAVAKDFNPAVIVTVDNGIANHAGVDAAKALGIKVIITDHHLPAETLPLADAIVNPNQASDNFPSKHIAGVGVIFYVMLALRRYLIDTGWFAEKQQTPPIMSQFLDLVALGTVADVVALDHNNRVLVYQGLRRIRAKQCSPGISALIEISGRNQARVTAADLGFAVAPRLNAAGRLDDMSLGIECLLSDDPVKAREIAELLNQLNDERRVIESDMQADALSALQKLQFNEKYLPKGVCLFDETWHQGVIGILAGRMKDKLHRPVIAFAVASDTELKGSARSISGLHIRDVLALIATQSPQLINKFGGHAMAAGLTIPRHLFEDFSKKFDEVVSSLLQEVDLQQRLVSDGELEPQQVSLEIAEMIREAGPWGQAFPEPLFEGEFTIIDQRLVGGKHLKLVLVHHHEAKNTIDAIAFNVDLAQWPNYRCQQIRAAYRLDINEYRGKRSVQLIIEHLADVCYN